MSARMKTRSSTRRLSKAPQLPTPSPSKSRTWTRRRENIKKDLSESEDEVSVPIPNTPEKPKMPGNNENVQVPLSPSVLLEQLNLANSPDKKLINTSPHKRKIVTPARYLGSSPTKQKKTDGDCEKENKSSSKKLFEENDIYSNARKALHSSYPTDMPGRTKELGELRDFIMEHVEGGSSGSLYVSGPPGTGKTASLNLILNDSKISSRLKHIYINCTAIKSSSAVYYQIAKELGLSPKSKSEKECSSVVENHLTRNRKTILLVLDEIDQLESKNQSILYTIFEWPSIRNAKLILIGIANALDLTDRILPRLQARCELKPKLLHFAPYTKQQIVEIFNARLKTAGVDKVFTPVALQMLAGKVAAVSGDVRRALDIGRRVIELIDENRNSKDILKPLENFTKELDNTNNNNNNTTEVKSVNLTEVVNVLNNVYGSSQNFQSNHDTFPLQQKILVCCLLLMLKKAKNKDVTIGRLFEIYRKVCAKRNIQIVDQSEFSTLCSLVEIRGIIRIIKKKDPKMSKINMMWDEQEVGDALMDKQLMASILDDVTCLGKM